MLIGTRLRILREAKGLSQGDIEKATGLRRCYVSRVENDHMAPTLQTLEKWAKALRMPVYAIFYEGKAKPQTPEPLAPGESPKDRRFVQQLRKSLGRMDREDRELLFRFAVTLATQRHSRGRSVNIEKSRLGTARLALQRSIFES